jgi:hypothetical protein
MCTPVRDERAVPVLARRDGRRAAGCSGSLQIGQFWIKRL